MAAPAAPDLLASAGALLLAVLAARFALREPRAFWWLTVALAPLAVPFRTGLGGAGLTVPLEPMLVLSGASLARLLLRSRDGAVRLARHPLFLATAAVLGWMAVASAAAPEPLVGFKATAMRALYAIVLLGGGSVVLRTEAELRRLVLVSTGALLLPSLWALARHAAAGFARRAAFESAQPFFSNRIDLVASLTTWSVVSIVLLLSRGRGGLPRRQAVSLAATVAFLLVALVALWARSPLVGAAAATVALPFLAGRTSPARAVAVLLASLCAAALGVTAVTAARSARSLPEPARGPFSPAADALLASGTFRDPSVLERLNRWSSAARMAAERPLTGFGPNGFERAYASYQRVTETTPDSSFAGARGDVHSEYLAALSEQGIPGLALLVALLGASVATAVRAARAAASPARRSLAVAFGAGLAAFAAMNVPNSFLDLDKVAPAFWLLAAGVLALDSGGLSAAPAPTSPEGC